MDKETGFNERLGQAIDDVKEYVNLKLRLIQLNLSEKISVALANVITSSVAFTFYILFFVFGSFAIAYWLGNVFNNNAAGFGIVAGFYLIVALLFGVGFKKQIRRKLRDNFISNFANENPNSNEDE